VSLELLRFKDLRRLGVVSSWPQLKYMMESYGFPRGFLLGANTRAWRAAEIEKWLADRPTEPSPHVMDRAERSVRARRSPDRSHEVKIEFSEVIESEKKPDHAAT
jgi:predicted DNA-binding transcriptional regulator AlpA